jgi:hypothetical protein
MEWLEGLTRKDWLLDGSPCSESQWKALDWSKAYMDLGPSPAGNLGPYWHVPNTKDECVNRLYPKVLQSKWARLIHQAITEATTRARND